MVETGYKQALVEAVSSARAQELQMRTEEDQLDLFGAVAAAVQPTHVPVVNGENGHRRMGRPQGCNKGTDEAARLYMSRYGDPLARAIEIAAIPILAADGVLAAFAQQIGAPSRFEAFKAWAAINASAMPFAHQRLATLTVRPEGSPDGEPIPLPWSYAEDEVFEQLELTHNPSRHEEAPES